MRAEYKLHSISMLFISQVIIPQVMFSQPIYIPRALNTGTCLRQGDLFYSAGLHRNHVLATANTEKSGEILEKMQVNGPEGQKQARKKSLAVSIAGMAIYQPTPGFKERTFQLCVLTRWDFNFCVCSSHLRGVVSQASSVPSSSGKKKFSIYATDFFFFLI